MRPADTRGKDETMWGKKDAGRSDADVRAGRNAMAEAAAREVAAAVGKGERLIEERRQRPDAARWAGAARRAASAATLRACIAELRRSAGNGALVGVDADLLERANATLGTLEEMAAQIE